MSWWNEVYNTLEIWKIFKKSVGFSNSVGLYPLDMHIWLMGAEIPKGVHSPLWNAQHRFFKFPGILGSLWWWHLAAALAVALTAALAAPAHFQVSWILLPQRRPRMAKRHHIPLQLPFSAVLREEGLIQSLYPRIHYSPVEVLVYTWFCGLAVLKVSFSLNSKQ